MSRSASRRKHDNKLNNQVDYRWILKRSRQTTTPKHNSHAAQGKTPWWSNAVVGTVQYRSFVQGTFAKGSNEIKMEEMQQKYNTHKNKDNKTVKTHTHTYIPELKKQKITWINGATDRNSSYRKKAHTHILRAQEAKENKNTQQRAENNITNKKLSARKYMSIHFEKHMQSQSEKRASEKERERDGAREPGESAWWTKRPNANHEAKHSRAQHIFEINVKP